MSLGRNKHLGRVLESHKMKHLDDMMEKYKKKREEIKDALEEKFFNQKVTRAINSGSYAKHTAINTKFDIDICQPFKYRSFNTLKEMADAVFDYFNNEYEDEDLVKYKMRKQRVSTGLSFMIDGEEIQMDVVPGKELAEDDYIDTNRLKLHVRAKGENPATATQTNIQKHVDLIKGKGDERCIIRLLKVWKVNKNKDRIKSFFLELITLRSFEKTPEIPDELWGKLKMTMEFIRDNVKTIRLEDPANTNNIISDAMTDTEKENLANDMDIMLKRIEEDEENLKIYFPVNDKFDSEKDEDKKKIAALEVARSGVISKPWCQL
ncbi:MAG: nucleotidyltransferase [Bacteroidales bacterium]|nr:nucleotidyltransferase [Bacteroidales bacterium]